MSYETIIAAFDSAARATAAIQDVRRMGVPSHDIRRHPADADTVADVAAAVATDASPGFWAWLFGNDDAEQRQIKLYQAALARGGTVVSVRIMADEAARVRGVIGAHAPIDLKDTA